MFPDRYIPGSTAQPHSSAGSSSSVQHDTEYLGASEARHDTDIGLPITFSEGQFQGKTVRMEIDEIQAAQLGRKYARVDRRPLDPPPVAHLRIFERDVASPRETENEMNYSDVQTLGLLCTVDLFPVPESFVDSSTGASNPADLFPSSPSSSSRQSPGVYHYHSINGPSGLHVGPNESHIRGTGGSSESSVTTTPQNTSQFSSYVLPSRVGDDVVYRIGDYPITENSKQTQALAGQTVVQGVIVDYQGRKAVLFVFSDLAVKIEGTFVLRYTGCTAPYSATEYGIQKIRAMRHVSIVFLPYGATYSSTGYGENKPSFPHHIPPRNMVACTQCYRVFDLFSSRTPATKDSTITAECYGGAFRVYSTKEFPGLPPSTDLTKHLARWGVRLNIRETERRRRRRSKSRDSSPA